MERGKPATNTSSCPLLCAQDGVQRHLDLTTQRHLQPVRCFSSKGHTGHPTPQSLDKQQRMLARLETWREV